MAGRRSWPADGRRRRSYWLTRGQTPGRTRGRCGRTLRLSWCLSRDGHRRARHHCAGHCRRGHTGRPNRTASRRARTGYLSRTGSHRARTGYLSRTGSHRARTGYLSRTGSHRARTGRLNRTASHCPGTGCLNRTATHRAGTDSLSRTGNHRARTGRPSPARSRRGHSGRPNRTASHCPRTGYLSRTGNHCPRTGYLSRTGNHRARTGRLSRTASRARCFCAGLHHCRNARREQAAARGHRRTCCPRTRGRTRPASSGATRGHRPPRCRRAGCPARCRGHSDPGRCRCDRSVRPNQPSTGAGRRLARHRPGRIHRGSPPENCGLPQRHRAGRPRSNPAGRRKAGQIARPGHRSPSQTASRPAATVRLPLVHQPRLIST